MECLSGRFRHAVEDALDSPLNVLATLGVSRLQFFRAMRDRPDIEMINLTEVHRDALVDSISARLRGIG
jgi:nucleoside-triphosphatase THEP1